MRKISFRWIYPLKKLKVLILIIVFVLPMFYPGMLLSQDDTNVELSIQLLDIEALASVNFDQKKFIQDVKNLTDKINQYFSREKKQIVFLFHITFHKDKIPTIIVDSIPSFNDKRNSLIKKQIMPIIKSVRMKIVDYSILITAKVNGGSDDKSKKIESLANLLILRENKEFTSADLKTKAKLLKKWAKKEVIPVLSAFQIIVDKKFSGVLKFGKIMKNINFSKKQDIDNLTKYNPHYWRAMMEMSQGNQLIPVSKIFLHIAKGEFDYIYKLQQISFYFSIPETLAYAYLDELQWKFKLFYDELHAEILKGIKLNDKGKYDEAVKIYENILRLYPNSAWANYELYFSKNVKLMMDNKDEMLLMINKKKGNKKAIDTKAWNKAKKIIYGCDPLYPIDTHASTGKEAYLLYRRLLLKELFENKDGFVKNLIKFADIALDLDAYSFAGHLYWMLLSNIKEKEYKPKNMMAHFLYCMHKLKQKKVLNYFKKDYSDEFDKIEKEKKELMENSVMYQNMKKKD